jgi:hypothetical protein
MPNSNTQWKVLPHGPLNALAENLWWVQGDIPHMQLKRTMLVARMRDGDLVLHSAIAMDETGMTALQALGRPAWLVVPNGWHRLDAARFKTRYPDIKVICPSGSRRLVEKVVAVDGTYEEHPRLSDSDDSVTFEHFGDRKKMEGAMIVRSKDGKTAVFGDFLFNLQHQAPGLFWLIYGRLLGNTGGPKVSFAGRLLLRLTRALKGYRAWLLRTAQTGEFIRIVPGHGDVITEDASEALKQVALSL